VYFTKYSVLEASESEQFGDHYTAGYGVSKVSLLLLVRMIVTPLDKRRRRLGGGGATTAAQVGERLPKLVGNERVE